MNAERPAIALPEGPTQRHSDIRPATIQPVFWHLVTRAWAARRTFLFRARGLRGLLDGGAVESLLAERGWEEITIAVRIVLDFAGRVRPQCPPRELAHGDGMAVLVQSVLASAVGGGDVRRRPR